MNKLNTTQPLYDQPSKMSQNELEMAWLGSIYENPNYCRSIGLMGLDRSMFKQQIVFDLGLAMLRDDEFQGLKSLCEDSGWFEILVKEGFISRLNALESVLLFLPALFKTYAREIEFRHDKPLVPAWVKKGTTA